MDGGCQAKGVKDGPAWVNKNVGYEKIPMSCWRQESKARDDKNKLQDFPAFADQITVHNNQRKPGGRQKQRNTGYYDIAGNEFPEAESTAHKVGQQ